ncbi:MAG TPA: hypothetical protein VLG40_00970 [Candidatus Saccharimonas sp.]|nr:hypothetical protein [Candidatus Saccharimonas sp.]
MSKHKLSRRWVLGLAGVAVAVACFLGVVQPARAATVNPAPVDTGGSGALPKAGSNAGTGSALGGPFTVNVDGTEVPVAKDTLGDLSGTSTTEAGVTVVPNDPGMKIAVETSGQISITNLQPGKHTATLNFKLTHDACTGFLQVIQLGGMLFCQQEGSGNNYYTLTQQWTFDVVAGQTVIFGGDDGTTTKSLGTAIEVDADGNPVIQCKNADILMKAIVCPMISSILGGLNWIMQSFIQPLLIINPLNTKNVDGSDSQLYTTWNNIRNFANIMFIATFFVIVFSQATSVGISNYGIKRLLPRLILIAIFTNLSFFVCSFLVDLFNILGTGAASLLVNSVVNGNPTISLGSDLITELFGNNVIGQMQGVLAEEVLAVPIMFGLFGFFLLAMVIMLIAAIIVVLRQIVLVFLIVFSPIAFVAGLLPNTQRYLSQWFEMYMRLLAMYPIMMLIFASGKVASTLVQQVGGGN